MLERTPPQSVMKADSLAIFPKHLKKKKYLIRPTPHCSLLKGTVLQGLNYASKKPFQTNTRMFPLKRTILSL